MILHLSDPQEPLYTQVLVLIVDLEYAGDHGEVGTNFILISSVHASQQAPTYDLGVEHIVVCL